MWRSGTAQKWKERGIRWIICLQDTNAVAIRGLPSALGVSAKLNLAMNSIGTPRVPGTAYGAICKLTDSDGAELTINIEYNQLNALLGDNGDAADPKTGFSPFPANTNTLIFRSDLYCEVLGKTKGLIPEFVNPKYVDFEKREEFRKATRLECMMQEYPKLLMEQGYRDSDGAKVGVTAFPKWMALQPVKKNIVDSQREAQDDILGMAEYSASNGEAAVYFCSRQYLAECGVTMPSMRLNQENGMNLRKFQGINVKYGARVVLMPSFAMTLKEMKQRVNGDKVKMTERSTLVLEGNVMIKSLELDGTLIVKTGPRFGNMTRIVIDGIKVANDGWKFKEIDDENADQIDDVYELRGYTLEKKGQRVIEFDDGKEHVVTL